MVSEIYNLQKLINEDSVSGYQFLAVNEKLTHVIFFCEDHFHLEEINDEISGWLKNDYDADSHLFAFNRDAFEDLLFSQYGKDVYSIIGYTPNSQNEIGSMTIAMGQGIEQYREYDFDVDLLQSQPSQYAKDFSDFKHKLLEILKFKEYLFPVSAK